MGAGSPAPEFREGSDTHAQRGNQHGRDGGGAQTGLPRKATGVNGWIEDNDSFRH